jgi:aminoglycoside phosphotransferase (APT) family kinase protein
LVELALDLTSLRPWLRNLDVHLADPCSVQLLAGGRSNRTIRLETHDGGAVALRMAAPNAPAGALRTMVREWRLVSGLASTPVPVPDPIGFSDDAAIVGAPFYVMGFVDGLLVDNIETAARLSPQGRVRLGLDLVRVLAELHRVGPDDVGLADIGKGVGFLSRQLELWDRVWHQWPSSELFPTVEAVHRELAQRAKPESAITIVHGDYKLGNVIADQDGVVLAVLDWELGTLGDPISDIGWVLSQWPEPGEEGTGENGDQSPTLGGGFPNRKELVEAYADVSGRDVSDIDYFEAMGHWKSTCEIAGVAHRAEQPGHAAEGSHNLVPTIESRARRALELLTGCRAETQPAPMDVQPRS